ncbi:Glycosyltransferase involved in cell wall bisynthesis [Flagellimonas taeanensis]|uniref:Glycosyltransferase involved in cell wall bisynthesis n=1 Tax=Flagellimonas taeanensis TaxID=1005926 RepID=A0A1M6V2G8_9FLAO|nr:glycosyltransferase family 4 protein [Allomuricauda taeanensis]SFC21143.1 Glycosyltransferase involved in cell wall bisynthesis [Allomuricauda taeanensis]SHK75702.1 Glycosyltransferase involved in cell wall bisynthesis [Allomuricauda taeanensis]
MKLLYLTNQISGPGGLERVLSIKASYLCDQLGHEVHIITLNDKHDSIFFKFSPNIKLHNIHLKSSPIAYAHGYLQGIRKIIAEVNPDIILVCDDGLKGMLLPRLMGKTKPMVYERHVSKNIAVQSDSPSLLQKIKAKIQYTLMAWGGSKYDAFVVLTKGNLNEWKLQNLRVIPNPLSFAPGESSHDREKVVIAVGKHSFQKGYDLLMEAWKIVGPKHPDWKLEIYGKSNPNFSIEPLIEKYGLQSSVHLFGPTKEIDSKFLRSSIHVLSSRYEGFGMVITEAMACGLPSISFDCPYGPSDIITDGHNGLLVENGKTEDMANSISKLIEDDALRKRLGHNAKISVNRYKIREMGKVWHDLFLELANRH